MENWQVPSVHREIVCHQDLFVQLATYTLFWRTMPPMRAKRSSHCKSVESVLVPTIIVGYLAHTLAPVQSDKYISNDLSSLRFEIRAAAL
eukprot:2819928-Amphidinium_carterae.1